MMTTRERNDKLQMKKMENRTKFFFEITDDSNEELKKVKAILEDVEAKTALIKDALVHFVNSEDFNLETYEGPGHRRR